jgi:hypothetical protein
MSQTPREAQFVIDMAKIGGFTVQYKPKYIIGKRDNEYGWIDRDPDKMYAKAYDACIYRLKPLEDSNGTIA